MSSRTHRFRITVEELRDPREHGAGLHVLTFEARNHDNILDVIERVRTGTAFSVDDASSLALGIKLLAGVTLVHREDPLFADIQPAIRAFTGNPKSRVAATSRQQRERQS